MGRKRLSSKELGLLEAVGLILSCTDYQLICLCCILPMKWYWFCTSIWGICFCLSEKKNALFSVFRAAVEADSQETGSKLIQSILFYNFYFRFNFPDSIFCFRFQIVRMDGYFQTSWGLLGWDTLGKGMDLILFTLSNLPISNIFLPAPVQGQHSSAVGARNALCTQWEFPYVRTLPHS